MTKQFVLYNNYFSLRTNKTRGIARGGILSPVLYNLFVADLPGYIKCDIFQFADILAINQYCGNNELKLNIQKTGHLRIKLRLKYYILKPDINISLNSNQKIFI